jgi:hypothetical protein
MNPPEVSFSATINELRQQNVRLAQELNEWRDLATTELWYRQLAEEEANHLKDSNKNLQRQAEDSVISATYFSPRLDTISLIVEELRKGMPLEGS